MGERAAQSFADGGDHDAPCVRERLRAQRRKSRGEAGISVVPCSHRSVALLALATTCKAHNTAEADEIVLIHHVFNKAHASGEISGNARDKRFLRRPRVRRRLRKHLSMTKRARSETVR